MNDLTSRQGGAVLGAIADCGDLADAVRHSGDRHAGNTRLAAPVVVCSDGCPSWSGKAAEEMTVLELVAMLRFARNY